MIRISKGLDLPISGAPKASLSDEPVSSSVALLSNDFILLNLDYDGKGDYFSEFLSIF